QWNGLKTLSQCPSSNVFIYGSIDHSLFSMDFFFTIVYLLFRLFYRIFSIYCGNLIVYVIKSILLRGILNACQETVKFPGAVRRNELLDLTVTNCITGFPSTVPLCNRRNKVAFIMLHIVGKITGCSIGSFLQVKTLIIFPANF